MQYMLNCVLWRMICAKEIASYLADAFSCLGPKGKGGSVYKREAQRVTGEQGKVAGKCVCVSWEGGGCLSIPSPHRDNYFCL